MPGTKAVPRRSIGAKRNPASEHAILEAARALLVEQGFAGFSIEAVARRAGAGKTTVYRWWPTKADLFIAVYMADKAATVAVPDTGDLVGDLVAYTAALWRFWRDTPSGDAFRALIAEAQASETALESLRAKFLPGRTAGLKEMFARAVARGEIAADEAEDRLRLYQGFNWFQLLTGHIEPDRALIERTMRLVAGRAAFDPTLPQSHRGRQPASSRRRTP